MTDRPPSFAVLFDEQPEQREQSAAGRAAALSPAAVFEEGHDGGPGPIGTHIGSGPHEPRFDGDTSELPPDVCWTLQELVAAPHVTDRSRKHWPVVVQYEEVLRSRLSELGLVLEINHEHRYAFTRQAGESSPHSRIILRARTLSLAASALALYLYQQYLVAPGDPVVETTDMVDHMMAYKREDDTDEAAFQKKIRTAVKSLDDASIIKQIKGTERYLVHGVITSILTAERVEALQQLYLAVARGEANQPEDDDTDPDTDPDPDPDDGPGTDHDDDPDAEADGD
ncbi:MAG TPA: DUF4194 domain-containing protein [Pseudonocardiaceae bacterium]